MDTTHTKDYKNCFVSFVLVVVEIVVPFVAEADSDFRSDQCRVRRRVR
jgi:hypothetical protein